MATDLSAAFAAARMAEITFRCVSKSPWEKLRRATFIPARSICSNTGGELDAGPIVATILVLCGGNDTISRAVCYSESRCRSSFGLKSLPDRAASITPSYYANGRDDFHVVRIGYRSKKSVGRASRR